MGGREDRKQKLWRFVGQLVCLIPWQKDPVSNKVERIDAQKFSSDLHTSAMTHMCRDI